MASDCFLGHVSLYTARSLHHMAPGRRPFGIIAKDLVRPARASFSKASLELLALSESVLFKLRPV